MIAKKPRLTDRNPTPEQMELMRSVQALVRKAIPKGTYTVDDLLEERRRESEPG